MNVCAGPDTTAPASEYQLPRNMHDVRPALSILLFGKQSERLDIILHQETCTTSDQHCLFFSLENNLSGWTLFSTKMTFTYLCILLLACIKWLEHSTQATVVLPTSLPSLHFLFTLKDKSMHVHGLSEFAVTANPIELANGNSVLYNVFSLFIENDVVYNYSIINGTGFSSNCLNDNHQHPFVQCLDDPTELGQLPPINSIVHALNEATAVSSTIDCPSGDLFKVVVNSIHFVLCKLDSLGFTMHSSKMDVKVEYSKTHQDIARSVPESNQTCSTIATPSFITPIGRSLLTGEPLPGNARRLKAAMMLPFFHKTSCSCKSIPRPCIFIHGLGIKKGLPKNEDTFINYWGGSLYKHTPCCTKLKFAHLNTVNYTWTSPKLQNQICDHALAVSDSSNNKTISNTIVVTHSMGGLMFAGALANGHCSLNSSSTWVSMAAPMIGSMASDFVQQSCEGKTSAIWEKYADMTGRCPVTTALKSLAYMGGKYSSDSLNAAYAAAQEAYEQNVYAVMCSESSSGIRSVSQVKFWALARMIGHQSHKNDGLVEFQSCAAGIPPSMFGNTWRHRYYKTKLNHYDMKLASGDALFNEQKMPVKWFECLL